MAGPNLLTVKRFGQLGQVDVNATRRLNKEVNFVCADANARVVTLYDIVVVVGPPPPTAFLTSISR